MVRVGVLLVLLASAATGQEPWEAMDYGPYLSASIEAPMPSGNITNKAIALPFRLADGQRYGAIFDTDLLRWSAGWTGEFVDLKGVVYDGIHGVFPAISGDQIWGTAAQPGWVHESAIADPRPRPWGPLPREWGQWKGLYLHEDKVVLSYRIDDVDVLDHGMLYEVGDERQFIRHLKLTANSKPRLHRVADGAIEIDGRVAKSKHASFGFHVRGATARWIKRDNALFLEVSASPGAVHLRLLTGDRDADLEAILTEASPHWDPRALVKGGPRRWAETSTTTVRPMTPKGDWTEVPYRANEQPSRLLIAEVPRTEATTWSLTNGGTAAALIEGDAAVAARRQSEPPTTKLWGHWPFDEGRGNTATDTVSERSITVDDPAWRRGYQNRALEFEGQTRGTVSGGAELDLHGSDVTVSAWVATQNDGTLLAKTRATGAWVADGKSFFIRDGKLCFDVGWVGAVSGKTVITDGAWHHVAFTYDATTATTELFVDGQFENKAVLRAKSAPSDHALQLGFTAPNFPATPWLHAKLDELRIYTRKLDHREIAALHGSALEREMQAYLAIDAPAGATWETEPGRLYLKIPAQKNGGVVTLATYRGAPSQTAAASSLRTAASRARPAYRVDALAWPDDNPWKSWMRFGGFDFFADGRRAAISTWSGDVWLVSGLDNSKLEWQRIATGLYQPLGLEIVDDQIYVLGRDQITRLVDLNGDHETDFYESFNNDTHNSSHFHEFALDLQLGADGNFYYMKGARHAKKALFPQHGTLMRVSRDGGTSTIVANGLRGPNGLAMRGDGAAYTTDQEGHWMPANRINRMIPGGFYGNGWSFFPEGPPKSYDPPICWVHPKIDRSPSAPVIVQSDQWSTPRGSLLSLSYGVGRVFHVLETVRNNVPQGAITPLPFQLPTGIMRARFHPVDGQLYVCGLFGWSADVTDPGGFYRVRLEGKAPAAPVAVRPAAGRIAIGFNEPLADTAVEPERYTIEAWNYRWTERYGSPEFKSSGEEGRDRWTISRIELSPDRKTVTLFVPDVKPVMQYHLELNLESQAGDAIETYLHGTINELIK